MQQQQLAAAIASAGPAFLVAIKKQIRTGIVSNKRSVEGVQNSLRWLKAFRIACAGCSGICQWRLRS